MKFWIAVLAFLLAPLTASASSVLLSWSAAALSSGSITGLGTNLVAINPSVVATLTLDINLTADADGLALAFFSLEFDRDLEDELNFVSLSFDPGDPAFHPILTGLVQIQESTLSQKGEIYGLAGATDSVGPVSAVIPFAQAVFTVNHPVQGDSFDVFSGFFRSGDTMLDNVGNGSAFALDRSTVNPIPEPGTAAMLGLGCGLLAFFGRWRPLAS